MDKDTANLIVPCLVVASILIYPASVKAYLMSWLERPSLKQQTPVRAVLWALITYISLDATSTEHHGFAGYVFIIVTMVFPVVALTWLSGMAGGIIAEKLFPEFDTDEPNHQDSIDDDEQ